MSREERDRDVWALIAELESVTKRLREAADKAAEHGWLEKKGDENAGDRTPD